MRWCVSITQGATEQSRTTRWAEPSYFMDKLILHSTYNTIYTADRSFSRRTPVLRGGSCIGGMGRSERPRQPATWGFKQLGCDGEMMAQFAPHTIFLAVAFQTRTIKFRGGKA